MDKELIELLEKIGFVEPNEDNTVLIYIYSFNNYACLKADNNCYYFDDSFGIIKDFVENYPFETLNCLDMINYIKNKFKQELRNQKINSLLNITL